MRSAKLAVVVLVAVAATGCRKKAPPQATGLPFDSLTDNGDASIAQPGSEGSRKIDFSIQVIHKDQKPSTTPPFHEAGGTWTFFDAKAADGTPFGFGFDEPKPGARSFSFGKVMLTAPDGAAGKRMVALFARTFEGKVPPEKATHPIAPKPISAAFLGMDANRGVGGGFSGEGGGWYATKLFLQKSGIEAEVFFNFNLKKKTGEFSEKDSDYANDMVRWLAAELRDGPPPKRTPQTDPNLTDAAPKIVWGRTLPGDPHGMSPQGDRYWITQPTDAGGRKLVSVGFEREDDATEILTVPHRLGSVRCAGDLCLANDSRPADPAEPNTWSSNDVDTVFLVDRKKKTSIELHGEGAKPVIPQVAAAADASLFVVGWYRKTGVNSAYQVLFLYGPDGKAQGPIEVGKLGVDVIGVTKTRILVEVGNKYGKDAKVSYVAIDPSTRAVSPATKPEAPEGILSPDKKRTVVCRREGAEIAVRDVAKGTERVFAVHEDDRVAIAEGCVAWASSRFLEYRANVTGWLDTETMKIALAPEGTPIGRLDYDKDFKWVVDKSEKKLRLGRITAP